MARILVVDDEVEACEALKEYLTLKGHIVDIAYYGNSALEKMKACLPDIILLDLIMPDIGGLEILKTMNEKYPGIKVIVVTVLNNEEDIFRTFELGACDYIAKPVNFELLDSVLNVQIGEI